MATSGKAFAISFAIYIGICLVITILFSWWRGRRLTKKFYAPKRAVQTEGYGRPPKLRGWIGWVFQIYNMNQAEVIRCGGVDAAMYMNILHMGLTLFVLVSLVSLIIILPINLTGSEVNRLMSTSATPTSNFTYWVPSPEPSPPSEGGLTSSDNAQTAETIQAPQFYNESIPPAPPGLEWWEYLSSVPPLPDPATLLGPAFARYGWRYDASYTSVSYHFTDLDKTTMANIPDRSPRLWAYAVVAYLVTFLAFWVLWRYSHEALRLRVFYFLNQKRGAESHTILLTDIPGIAYGTIPKRLDGTLLRLVPKKIKEPAFKRINELGEVTAAAVKHQGARMDFAKAAARGSNAEAAAKLSTFATEIDPKTGRWQMPDPWDLAVEEVKSGRSIQEIVDSEFKAVYPETFGAANLAFDTSELDPLVAEYEKKKTLLEDLLDDYISKKRRGKKLKLKKSTVVGATMGAWGREKYGLKPTKVPTFIFLHDRLARLKVEIEEKQVAAREKHFPAAFITFTSRFSQPAPKPEEVIWTNLGWRDWERAGRRMVMLCAFIAMTLFFMIPVAAVQAILSTNSLVSAFQDIAILSAIVTAIIPGLALKIFLALVPSIILAMNKFAGMVSLSQLDMGLVSRFYVFQVITVFFGSFIAGSFFNQIKQFIDDPGSIVTVLGTAAPQTAIFFTTYLMVQSFITIPLGLMRLVSLVLFWLKSMLAGTERAKRRLWADQEFTYGTVIPNDMISFLLGVTFCLICPIIAPFALVYFLVAYIANKYSLVYVYTQPYQTGGMIWKNAFNQGCAGLIIFQIIMIAILGIKKTIGPPIFMVPLPIFTLIFMVAGHARFWKPFEGLALLTASLLDAKEDKALADGELEPPTDKEVAERYLSPSLKLDFPDHDQLVRDALRMQAVIEGGEDEELFGEADEEDDVQESSSTVSEVPPKSPGDLESGKSREGSPAVEETVMEPQPSGNSLKEVKTGAAPIVEEDTGASKKTT